MSPNLGIFASQISGHLAAPSSFYNIATATGNNTSTTITFSSIPQTYKSLQIRILGSVALGSYNNGSIYCQFNGDSTAANYRNHWMLGDGTNASANQSVTSRLYNGPDTPVTTSYFGAGIIDFIDYTSTSKNKTTRAFTGYDLNGLSTGYVVLSSSLWMNTSAITSISLVAGDGNWATGTTFALYGVN
jgi:hypothetical protein